MIHPIIKRNAIVFGILTGICLSAFTAFPFFSDLNLFTSFWIAFLKFAVPLVIFSTLLDKTKRDLNGVFPLKEAFTTYFIASLIGILISAFVSIVLFNWIFPEAKPVVTDLNIQYMTANMKSNKVSVAEIEKIAKSIRESDQFSIAEQLKGLPLTIIFSSIVGLIIAAVFKSKTPQNQGQN